MLSAIESIDKTFSTLSAEFLSRIFDIKLVGVL